MPTLKSTRRATAGVLALLSVLAIVATLGNDEQGASYVPSVAASIREPALLFGSAGLGGLMLLRSAGTFLPRPWRVYVDRLEFSFTTMLWILWTSATMSFSAATISSTVCSIDNSNSSTPPPCTTVTFDMFLLHSLSLASFAYLVIVLSTALSPGYFASHSTSLDGLDAMGGEGVGGEEGSVFVMWDLALGDSPKGLRAELPGQTSRPSGYETAYGTAGPSAAGGGSTVEVEPTGIAGKADRFASGRVGLYVPLLVASLGVIASLSVVTLKGSFISLTAISVLALAFATMVFTLSFLFLHRRDRSIASSIVTSNRKRRAIELGSILLLFVLWPVAATLFTLNPTATSKPCTASNAASVPSFMTLMLNTTGEDKDDDATDLLKNWLSTCNLSLLILSLSWTSAWLALARAVNLIFPMPTASDKPSIAVPALGHPRALLAGRGEGQPLLAGNAARSGEAGGREDVQRPQVKYGRLVAGEAFELGDDED